MQEALAQREPELLWYRRFLPLAATTIAVVVFLTVSLSGHESGGLRESMIENTAGNPHTRMAWPDDPQETLVKHPKWLERCWDQTHLRGDPGQYSENVGPVTMSNGSRLEFNRGDVPYVFVVPTMTSGCPSWFQANLINTVNVQRTQARSSVFRPDKLHPVVLVEGSSPACQVNLTWYPVD